MKKIYFAVAVLLFLAACSIRKPSPSEESGVVVVHHAALAVPTEAVQFPFGGISGVDYDPEQEKYIVISDDKGEFGPPRAYLFRLSKNNQIEELEEVVLNFDKFDKQGVHVQRQVDPESVRFLSSDSIVWSSEIGNVFITNLNTGVTSEFSIPAEFLPGNQTHLGARKNKFIEGISFFEGRKKILFALEAPLKQDGPVATVANGSYTRVLMFDFATQVLLDQYFYPLDRIPKEAEVEPRWSDNGVSEILVINDRSMLVVERSGRHIGNMDFAYDVRCYLVELPKISDKQADPGNSDLLILKKKLLFNFGDLLPQQENIEGITFGLKPINGSSSDGLALLLISDSGFHPNRKTYLTKLLIDLPQE